MNLYLSKLVNVGVTPGMDRLEAGRIQLLNNLSILSMAICLVLIPITILEGLVIQPIFISVALFLLSVTIWLNWQGHHGVGRLYFIFTGSAIVCMITINAYSQGLFTDTENIFYGYMAVVMLLFSGFQKHFAYWLMFAILMALKYLKLSFISVAPDLGFWLTLQNSLIVGVILYLFLMAFFNILSKSLRDVVKKENALYSLIDHVPIFMALLDKDRRYKIVNQQYVDAFGRPRDKIIGTLSKEILPENIWDVHSPLIEKALKGESPSFLDKTEMPDGSYIYASGRYVPILDPETNEVMEITVFVDDVSDLKDAEKKLKDELKDKDKLFSIIAHDIRSPLNLFEGLLNASDNQIITQDEFLVFKDKLRERFIALQETINGLLEWSRLQLDRIQPTSIRFNPKVVISELIGVFKPIAESKNITLVQQGESSEIEMDVNHFRIIMRNILHNALKFTQSDGKIEVTYLFEDNNRSITISDTGIGMSQELIQKLLSNQKIKSVPGTLGESGTGLGLSLSLELVLKNNCEIEIVSDGTNGTKFILKLR